MRNSWIENPNDRNMLYYPFYMWNLFFLENTEISIFGGISKFHLWANFGKFWQFWGSFGQILLD
jgi:hypothetical protein